MISSSAPASVFIFYIAHQLFDPAVQFYDPILQVLDDILQFIDAVLQFYDPVLLFSNENHWDLKLDHFINSTP